MERNIPSVSPRDIISTDPTEMIEENFTTEVSEDVDENVNTEVSVDANASATDLIYEAEQSCTTEAGEVFPHLADVPTSDPCQLCQCSSGSIVCATEECVL